MIRLLICDDEPAITQLLKRYLASKGYEVDIAADLDEVILRLKSQKYEVLVTDLNLGHSDGFDVLHEVKSRGYTLPVLFTTGYPSQETAIKALRSGAFDYLIKPFALEEVAERIERAATMGRMRAENAVYARLVSLQAAGKALAHITRKPELLHESARLMTKLLRADQGWFYAGALGDAAVLGQTGECFPPAENLTQQTQIISLAEKAMLAGEPQTTDSSLPADGAEGHGGKAARFLAVPVELRSTVIGALLARRDVTKPAFDAVDFELATQLSGTVGLNLRAMGAQYGFGSDRENERPTSLPSTQDKALLAWADLIGQLVDQHCPDYESKLQRVFALGRALIETLDWNHLTENDWRVLSQVYDLSKLRVPQQLLVKRGPLDDKERDFLKQQSQWAKERLADVPGMEEASQAIEDMHEAFDGTGYPRGKRGHAIDARARLLAVVDAYVAMTSTRPYRSPMRPGEAIEAIRRRSGTHFDPSIVLALSNLGRT
jgi:response regulator RpfG family c-di-GMP phosphodiesterase